MFTPIIRLIIGIIGLALTIYYLIEENTTSAYLTLIAVALVIWGYFKNGTVYLAWRKIKSEDFDGAERILNQTRYPEFLKSEQRGFYHFIKGAINSHRNNHDNAYKNFLEALKFGVRTENNRAIINLNLADIELQKGRISEAKVYLQNAQTLRYNDRLKPEILKIEARINNIA